MKVKRLIKKNWPIAPTAIVLFIILLPVWWVISSSFTYKDRLFQTPVSYFPTPLTFENYRTLFEHMPVGTMLYNTMIVTVFTLIISNILCMLAAYGYSHTRLKIVKMSLALLVASSFVPVISTVIPMFQFFTNMGLTDSHHVLIILYVSHFFPFTIVIITTFMSQLPRSIEEAAAIDGANVFVIIFKILLPLMIPAITTMSIINFIRSINEFMLPLIFTSRRVVVLSVGLTMIPRIDQFLVPWDLVSALVTIMIVPIIIFVVIFEKKIMSGLMSGSIKQ